MGSLRFEPRHLIYPHRRNPVPLTSSSPVFTVTGSKSSIVVDRKKLINNESSDSGFAGLDNGSTTSNKGTSTLIQPADENLHQYIIDHSKNTSYLKGKFLGKGGSARVHELTDLTTGNVYAGKIIPKSRITEPRHKEKITREIELQRNLVHLNVVRYHHSFEDSDNFYIIVENCSKKSLVHVMKYRKTLTEPEVRFYLRQLIDGLRYVHESQIVHRDLKLGNMFLSENMTLKIGDFGLAARLDEFDVAICGTPNYIAPEVLSCQGHGFEADLWAMGCIMYAMLVGQPPFETSRLNETYSRITNNLYVFPKSVSCSARSLIRQLLAHDPTDRPTLEQVLKHDFFTSGFVPTSLPSSCCYKSPNFGSNNDSGIKSDIDSSNENIDPLTYQESVKVSNSNHSHKYVTSQSLKETSVKKETVCSDKNDSRPFSPAVQQSLYSALDSCLDHAPHTLSNPTPVAYNPLFISKWIDYSNKYGFGFQLSDQTVGVLFNDRTRISYSSDRNCLDFQDSVGKICSYSLNSDLPPHVMERLNLLRYFAKFMDENLTKGCDNQQNQSSYVHMKRWVRTPKAIIMQLDNNTLQINFFNDHTKIILSTDTTTQCWVTYIDSDRLSTTYRLEDITKYGCESTLRQRLVFALTVLREFSELDGDNL